MTGFTTIAEASRAIASKKVSPVELTQACLDQIEACDGTLNAFILVTADKALADARAAEAAILRDGPSNPLHGIPIGLKDIIETAGIATTAHSAQLHDNVPTTDATVTEKLAAAGTVLMGKLSTHEFANGGPSFDLPWPPARNPWNPDHFTAGSSSGTGAAVPSGMILGGLGTDTGGSIRGPAALCGIAGLKATYGRVSRAGVFPAAFSLDHIGPMAWTSEDCALLLQALAGHDPRDPASAKVAVPDYAAELGAGVRGLRIGVIHHFHETDNPASAGTLKGIEDAIGVLRGLGAEIREVKISPLHDWSACGSIISIAERAAAYDSMMRGSLEKFGQRLRSRLITSIFVGGADYVEAVRRRRELCAEMAVAMGDLDLLLTAVQPNEAGRIDSIPFWDNMDKPNFTMPFNVTGLPALSVCTGYGALGLPVAMQLVGHPFAEATVLRAGHAYEQATAWRTMRPSLSFSHAGVKAAAE